VADESGGQAEVRAEDVNENRSTFYKRCNKNIFSSIVVGVYEMTYLRNKVSFFFDTLGIFLFSYFVPNLSKELLNSLNLYILFC
jgi:hypothetical protein